jgi:signal transduction histidine kinase
MPLKESQMKIQSNTNKPLFQPVPVRIILPVVLTVLLFISTIFFLIIPLLKDQMMFRKREMIRELTQTAWSTLEAYHLKEKAGILSLENAKAQAIENLRHLRYGPEFKDYFWINDLHPRIIMHPYRDDLEGKDISDFADPTGKLIFKAFVDIVQKRGAGFVDYEWQWKDDPDRIVPKISFVKGFEPWGWIVGTGIYIEDVRSEIMAISRKLTLMCLGILAVIMGLSSYIIWQGLKVDRRRRKAEQQARIQQEQIFQAAKMASLGTLISGVAHEINNPITSVMLNAPIIQKIWDNISPILKKYCRQQGDIQIGGMSYAMIAQRLPLLIADISESAHRVKTIVGDLKDYARQNPPEMNDDVDINRVAEKAVGLVSNMIKKSTLNFSENYYPSLPKIKGNTQRIEQVVINLLVNACQAITDSEQPITISTGFDRSEGCVMIKVKDEGSGMDEKVIQQIRDPFFTTKREKGGTGLGLSICEKIVHDHNGSMEFQSILEKGTVVTIQLPVAKNLNMFSEKAYDKTDRG